MNESSIVKKIIEKNPKFTVSLAADIYLKKIDNDYLVERYGVGPAPSFSQVLEYSESFSLLDDAAMKFKSIRHNYKIGFDYEQDRFGEGE